MARDEGALAYLEQVLALDPGHHAQSMLELRARQQSGSSTPPPAPREVLRAQARGAIDALRRDLWSLDSRTLQRCVRDAGVDAFPDLRRELARLEQGAQHRQALEALAASPGIDPFLVEALKEQLTLPRAEAAAKRDALLQIARGHPWRRRRALRRTARAMTRRLPDLAPTERELLERVRGIEEERRLARDAKRTKPRSFLAGAPRLFGLVLLIMTLFTVVLAVIAMCLR